MAQQVPGDVVRRGFGDASPSGERERWVHVLAHDGIEHVLKRGHPIMIGRGPSATVRILNDRVSRGHVTIVGDERGFFIRDEGSSNGTFVSNMRLDPGVSRLLEPGDLITLGGSDSCERLYFERRFAGDDHLRDRSTGLLNDSGFSSRLSDFYYNCRDRGVTPHAWVFNLQGLRASNSRYGAPVTNRWLRLFAAHLRRVARVGHSAPAASVGELAPRSLDPIVARLGGTKFCLVAEQPVLISQQRIVAEMAAAIDESDDAQVRALEISPVVFAVPTDLWAADFVTVRERIARVGDDDAPAPQPGFLDQTATARPTASAADFPQPCAYAEALYRKVADDARRAALEVRLKRATFVVEEIFRVFALAMIADEHRAASVTERVAGFRAAVEKTLSRARSASEPSTGVWIALTYGLATADRSRWAYIVYQAIGRNRQGEYEQVVAYRNKDAHAMVPDRTLVEWNERAAGLISQLTLNSAICVWRDLELVRVLEAYNRDDADEYRVERLHGSDPTLFRTACFAAPPGCRLVSDGIYLMNRHARGEFARVDPLVVQRTCQHCGQVRVYIAESWDPKRGLWMSTMNEGCDRIWVPLDAAGRPIAE